MEPGSQKIELVDSKKKVEELIIQEAGRELAMEYKNPEQASKDLLGKSEKIKAVMEARYFELTGKKNELQVDALYRDMLRGMMLNVGLLKAETTEALKAEYQKKGAIEPLLTVKKEAKNSVQGNGKNCLANIPKEAVECEELGLFFIKHFCTKDNLLMNVFFDQLGNYVRDKALNKQRAEMASKMQKENLENKKADLDKTKSQKENEKEETFAEMSANRKKSYIVGRENLVDGNLLEQGAGSSKIKEAIKNFTSDPVIAVDLESFVDKYEKLYVDAKSLSDIQASQEVIKQAQILGLN